MLLQALVDNVLRPRSLLIPVVALAAVVVFQALYPARQGSAAGAVLSFPASACTGDTATVAFSWQPIAGGQVQWLDLSLEDNGFLEGTFIGTQLPAGANSFSWSGILKGLPHYWRINTLTQEGWVVSDTGTFVPCGGPILLWGPMTCADTFSAILDFRWSPMSPGGTQWLDLGFDPNFSPGSFVGAGPLPSELSNYHWEGIQANVTYFFRLNSLDANGNWHTSQVGSFYAPCAPPASWNPDIYGSDDVLYSPALGINAPVNVRDVGPDGAMGDPVGPIDVVRYNFGLFPGLGGYPGMGGTTVIAGHVDYRNYGLAVFAPLRNVQVGDIIEYHRGDGVVITYQVDWFADLDPTTDWNSLMVSSNPETLLLITCNGEFNFVLREYSHRRAVHAVRIS